MFREGSKINQIICAILIHMPVFVYGASIGWLSPMTLLFQSDQSPSGKALTDTEISWIASIPYLVSIPMNFMMAAMSDIFGRKFALIFISIANAMSWMLLLISTDLWALILARFLVGIPMAGCYVTCPIYTKEISDDSIRGTLGCFIIIFQTSGNLFLYVIGDILSYDTILWICLAIPIAHVILFLTMPESPSFLVKTGKIKEATKALVWLKCRNEKANKIQQEINLINKEQMNDETANSFLLKTILTENILVKALAIAVIAALAREGCGAVPVLNFAGDIFSVASSGSSIMFSPNQQAMILGTVQVFGSILASSVVEKLGRKPLLFLSSFISGLSMCALATWFMLRDYQILAPTWIPLFTLCLCIFCDASGMSPMSVVLAGEIFSYKYRSTVLAVSMAIASLADFFQLLIFKHLASAIGIHVAFYFFCIICILMAIYVIVQIPETKGRSLEDIYKDLSKDEKKEIKEKDGRNIQLIS